MYKCYVARNSTVQPAYISWCMQLRYRRKIIYNEPKWRERAEISEGLDLARIKEKSLQTLVVLRLRHVRSFVHLFRNYARGRVCVSLFGSSRTHSRKRARGLTLLQNILWSNMARQYPLDARFIESRLLLLFGIIEPSLAVER